MLHNISYLFQKSDKFWLRPWNWEDIYSFEAHKYDYKSGSNYISQIYDGVIDTILNFTSYGDRESIESLLESQELEFYTLFHDRKDYKKRFEGITLSIGLKVNGGWDRFDLIFEDEVKDGKIDGVVNSVRLYYSPYHRYVERDFDMFYWDSSDRRSLDIFQTGYRDAIHFYKKSKSKKISPLRKITVGNFQKLFSTVPKGSFR
jgi:hypothetical protein